MGESCTKDCYVGNKINEDQAVQVIKENEFKDTLFTSNLIGNINCLDNKPMTGLTVSIKDDYGYEFKLESDALGNFNLPYIQKGQYILKFSNSNLPIYNSDDLDAIILRLNDIILGSSAATNIDYLAYNLIDYKNGLTTYDLLLFRKLRNNDLAIDQIKFPWRYAFTDSLNHTQVISDSLIINLETAQKLSIHITPIFFGDPYGQFCK